MTRLGTRGGARRSALDAPLPRSWRAIPLGAAATIWSVLAAAAPCAVANAQGPTPEIELRPGLIITQSVRVVPKTYRFPAPTSLDAPLVTIRGDDVTVDFQGAVLEGLEPSADPDQATGLAVFIDGGTNVTLSNAVVRGYKIGILARSTRGLTVTGSDLSYNWKPRLYSLVEHESLVDWLSYHDNEDRQWLRFGAAIYLEGVTTGVIRGNTVMQGMNGLLMTRSDSVTVIDNRFTHNSGLGIGLYHSSDNRILRNRLDYNVRGYSEGFYQRGQDSAGLLIYSESHRNVVAWNSATHSGDGLFLWAGNRTMETGQGGATDNLFFGNDFSYAPTNAMEATFSRNTFVANRAVGSTYGLWGGYSWSSRVVGNCFAGNRYGVAIEHGQDNLIAWNRFHGDSTAVQLWARESEPADWGYPQHRDTRSRDTRIVHNTIVASRVGVRGTRTSGVTVTDNILAAVESVAVFVDTADVHWSDNAERSSGPEPGTGPGAACGPVPAEYAALEPAVPDGEALIPTSPEARRPRSAIVVDEWGPYDRRVPQLWPVDSTRAVPLRLAVLGPPGRWRLVGHRGLAAIPDSAGIVGDTIAVTPMTEDGADWDVNLEYVGAETVSPRGERRPPGTPYRFSYGRFELRAAWTVRFFRWTDVTHPVEQPRAFASLLDGAPLLVRTEPRLAYLWYRPRITELPAERFALAAEATVTLPPGAYTLRTISDDAVRVWVDGELVIDHWEPHGSEIDTAPLAPGRHTLRVEYYQAGGWTELRLDIVRGNEGPGGSPGPH